MIIKKNKNMKHFSLLLIAIVILAASCGTSKKSSKPEIVEPEFQWPDWDSIDVDTSFGINFWTDSLTLRIDTAQWYAVKPRVIKTEPLEPTMGLDKDNTIYEYIDKDLVLHDYTDDEISPFGGVPLLSVNPDTIKQTYLIAKRVLIEWVCEPDGTICDSRGWMVFKTNYYRGINGPDTESREPERVYMEDGSFLADEKLLLRAYQFKWQTQ
jgi:hypothetical protein